MTALGRTGTSGTPVGEGDLGGLFGWLTTVAGWSGAEVTMR